jgi:hypothetical protein
MAGFTVTTKHETAILLDTSSLLAIGRSRWLGGFLKETHQRMDRPILTPTACLAAAGREKPGLVKHVGMLPVVTVIALEFHHLLACERWKWPDLDVAHAATAALPNPEFPEGMVIVTAKPVLYERWPQIRTKELPTR